MVKYPIVHQSNVRRAARSRSTSLNWDVLGDEEGSSSATSFVSTTSAARKLNKGARFQKIWRQATAKERKAIRELLQQAGNFVAMPLREKFVNLKRLLCPVGTVLINQIGRRNRPQTNQPPSSSTEYLQTSARLATETSSTSGLGRVNTYLI